MEEEYLLSTLINSFYCTVLSYFQKMSNIPSVVSTMVSTQNPLIQGLFGMLVKSLDEKKRVDLFNVAKVNVDFNKKKEEKKKKQSDKPHKEHAINDDIKLRDALAWSLYN